MSGAISDLELVGMRLDVEEFFEDEGIFERITNKGTVQPNGTLLGEIRIPIYEGRCTVDPVLSRRDRFDAIGEGLTFTRQYQVDIPWDAPQIQIRDIFTATQSRDPRLIGRPMEVRDPIVETDLAVRRIGVHDTAE